ncbi:MAG: diacylglycerol kinase family lipid kinase [Gemmatimonadota bacterium]|nr:MAG: diacylglycerol kinase family lipid kinase [Gemmatimonadota bacterium]
MRRPERLRRRIEAALTARGVEYEHAYTNAPGHGPELVAEALARGFRRFLVAGGDGTVREAVTALAGSDATLALIPVGTGNQLAANLGVPRRLGGSIKTALDGDVRRIDLGIVNGRPFTSIVGAGLDAEIVRPEPRIKRRVGYLAYIHAATVAALSPKPALIRIELDDGQVISGRGLGVEIMNMRGLTAPGLPRPVPVVPHARMDDGKLDGCLFLAESTLGYFSVLGDILTRRYEKSPRLRYFSGKRIVVSAEPPLRTQADGELLGETPFEVGVWPLALKVLVPAS